MADPTKGMVVAAPERPPQLMEGYVSRNRPAPMSFDDPVWVIVPEYSTVAAIGPCPWGAIHGATLLAEGSRVVLFDGPVPVVIWWEGEHS